MVPFRDISLLRLPAGAFVSPREAPVVGEPPAHEGRATCTCIRAYTSTSDGSIAVGAENRRGGSELVGEGGLQQPEGEAAGDALRVLPGDPRAGGDADPLGGLDLREVVPLADRPEDRGPGAAGCGFHRLALLAHDHSLYLCRSSLNVSPLLRPCPRGICASVRHILVGHGG